MKASPKFLLLVFSLLLLIHCSCVLSARSFNTESKSVTASPFNEQLYFNEGDDSSELSIIWQQTFGGSCEEVAHSIENTSDSNYIIAGSAESSDGQVTNSHGNEDFWVTEVSQNGDLLWQKSFGGGARDEAFSIKRTAENGYVVAGFTYSFGGDVHGNHGVADFWLIKIDNFGDLEWQKCYGGSGSDICYSASLTRDGGYILAGATHSSDGDLTGDHSSGDFWIVKVRSDGSLQWQRAYGGSALDFAHDIVQSADGGFLVAGYARSTDGDVASNHGQEDMWILKLDSLGNIKWQKSYGGTGGEGANSLQQTMDGGYILAGVTHSFNLDVIGNHGDHDFWVVKIDSVGNMLWSQCLGGSLSDNGDFIKETADGGFLVAGMSASSDGMLNFNHGKYDFWVVKLTSAGSAEWQYSLGGSQDEECLSLSENTDGSITLAGYSSSNDGDVSGNHGLSDFWIVKCSLPVFHTYYADTDGDSFGDANNKIIAEEPPAGYVTNSLDCNDSNSAIHPGAIDDCNGIDDDCDFYIDENFITANIWPLTTATICNTSQLTLHCDTAEGYTYQWLTGSQPIAGATNSSYVVTRAGKYSVKITKGLCTANSPQTIIKITFQNVSVSPTGTTKVCGSTPVMFSVPNSPGLIYQWYGPEGLITGATGAYFPATKPGDYYVNISDIVGCSFNSSTSTLIYSPAAEVFISATGKLNICTTGSVTLNALINSDYDYEWYRNGGAIAGATNSYYVATEAGSYKYLATTSDGCTAFSKSKNVTDCKEVHEGDEIISGGSLKIFPNPSAGNFIAEFQTDDSFSGDGLLQIYNLTGQIVQSASVEIIKGSLQFHLSLPNNLPGGTYFVKLFADGTEFLSRITLAR